MKPLFRNQIELVHKYLHWFRSMSLKKRIGLFFALFILVAIGASLALGVYRILKWNLYPWIPEYLRMNITAEEKADDRVKHLIMIFVDHYEPGYEKNGALKAHKAWLDSYRKATQGHKDSFGNRVKYTWFYPYDQKNDEVLVSLTEAVFRGLGEVELHWHHPQSNNEQFPGMLQQAIDWFGQYGALKVCGGQVSSAFSFIHGNWALDDSATDDTGRRFCGVTREIEFLFNKGCYADYTFSTIGTYAQPTRKINTIYYVTDTLERKSHDDGDEVRVGREVSDRLMIIQGPLGIYPLDFWRIEYGAIEEHQLPTQKRINRWVDTNIHVKGKPEWVFVKLYSHGIQSSLIMKNHFSNMLTQIEETTRKRGIKLHYMSAREGYNVIKAAEAGRTGNPEDYRDFMVPKPCNSYFHTKKKVSISGFENGRVLFETIQ